MNLTDTVTVPHQVMTRRVGEETVILDLASGTYYGLDAVGARIWELLAMGGNLSQVCQTMLEEFDVQQAQLETDVLSLTQTLLDKQLLQRGA